MDALEAEIKLVEAMRAAASAATHSDDPNIALVAAREEKALDARLAALTREEGKNE